MRKKRFRTLFIFGFLLLCLILVTTLLKRQQVIRKQATKQEIKNIYVTIVGKTLNNNNEPIASYQSKGVPEHLLSKNLYAPQFDWGKWDYHSEIYLLNPQQETASLKLTFTKGMGLEKPQAENQTVNLTIEPKRTLAISETDAVRSLPTEKYAVSIASDRPIAGTVISWKEGNQSSPSDSEIVYMNNLIPAQLAGTKIGNMKAYHHYEGDYQWESGHSLMNILDQPVRARISVIMTDRSKEEKIKEEKEVTIPPKVAVNFLMADFPTGLDKEDDYHGSLVAEVIEPANTKALVGGFQIHNTGTKVRTSDIFSYTAMSEAEASECNIHFPTYLNYVSEYNRKLIHGFTVQSFTGLPQGANYQWIESPTNIAEGTIATGGLEPGESRQHAYYQYENSRESFLDKRFATKLCGQNGRKIISLSNSVTNDDKTPKFSAGASGHSEIWQGNKFHVPLANWEKNTQQVLVYNPGLEQTAVKLTIRNKEGKVIKQSGRILESKKIATVFSLGKYSLLGDTIGSLEINTVDNPSTDDILFQDNFNRINLFDKNWQITGQRQNFSTSNSYSFEGEKALKIYNKGSDNSNTGGDLQAVSCKDLSNITTGIVRAKFYDYGDNRSVGSVFSIGDENSEHYIMFLINKENSNYYQYRINDTYIPIKIERTPGWHTLEFVVTPHGTYGKIDNQSLYNTGLNFPLAEKNNIPVTENRQEDIGYHVGVNTELKSLDNINFGRGWSYEGNTYFDDLKVVPLFDVPENPQKILDATADKVYATYKDTDISEIKADVLNGPKHAHGTTDSARKIAGYAMMKAYYFSRKGSQEDLQDAKKNIRFLIDTYDYWGQAWLSQVTTNLLSFDVWWLWDYLDNSTRNKFADVMASEADFWVYRLEEIRKNPWQKTLPDRIRSLRLDSETERVYNIETVTSLEKDGKGNANRYLEDTKAEEQAAQICSGAYNMFPQHPHADKWQKAAKCYAELTLSKGDKVCTDFCQEKESSIPYIEGRTITNDLIISNHGHRPNPGYTFAAICGLQQGEFNYHLTGNPVPKEFRQYIQEKTDSAVWQKNVENCLIPGTYLRDCSCVWETTREINAYNNCVRELNNQWSNRDMVIEPFILSFWAKMNNDQISQEKLKKVLSYLYYFRKDTIFDTAPLGEPVGKISPREDTGKPLAKQEEYLFWRNMESVVQLAAKYYILDNYQNTEFRSRFFPVLNSFSQPTPTPTQEPTSTPTLTPSPGPTDKPEPTTQPTQEPQPTQQPTNIPTPTTPPPPQATNTPTPTPTSTPIPTNIPTSTPTPKETPSLSPTTPPEEKLRSDLNGDGRVDEIDYAILITNFAQSGPTGSLSGDINRDGQVDEIDYAILIIDFGSTN